MRPGRIAGFAAGALAAVALASGAARAGGASPYTDADLTFLTHMIVHHEQALELCALVPSAQQPRGVPPLRALRQRLAGG